MKFLRKKIIYGCESRGDAQSPYLTRYTLLEMFDFKIYLHVFHRSDSPELHDHPWPFVSILLWRGYIEETPAGKRRFWPGSILFRPAEYCHRVELANDRSAVTLVFVGRRQRDWGFFTANGWQQWLEYFKQRGC